MRIAELRRGLGKNAIGEWGAPTKAITQKISHLSCWVFDELCRLAVADDAFNVVDVLEAEDLDRGNVLIDVEADVLGGNVQTAEPEVEDDAREAAAVVGVEAVAVVDEQLAGGREVGVQVDGNGVRSLPA